MSVTPYMDSVRVMENVDARLERIGEPLSVSQRNEIQKSVLWGFYDFPEPRLAQKTRAGLEKLMATGPMTNGEVLEAVQVQQLTRAIKNLLDSGDTIEGISKATQQDCEYVEHTWHWLYKNGHINMAPPYKYIRQDIVEEADKFSLPKEEEPEPKPKKKQFGLAKAKFDQIEDLISTGHTVDEIRECAGVTQHRVVSVWRQMQDHGEVEADPE